MRTLWCKRNDSFYTTKVVFCRIDHKLKSTKEIEEIPITATNNVTPHGLSYSHNLTAFAANDI